VCRHVLRDRRFGFPHLLRTGPLRRRNGTVIRGPAEMVVG
jgi:hypothetical protein